MRGKRPGSTLVLEWSIWGRKVRRNCSSHAIEEALLLQGSSEPNPSAPLAGKLKCRWGQTEGLQEKAGAEENEVLRGLVPSSDSAPQNHSWGRQYSHAPCSRP